MTECPAGDLGTVSVLLEAEPDSPAGQIAMLAVRRAAKIAAVLCAGPISRVAGDTVRVAVEGSQYWRLTGFREAFHRELARLLPTVTCRIVRTENACLLGAARAAFAERM